MSVTLSLSWNLYCIITLAVSYNFDVIQGKIVWVTLVIVATSSKNLFVKLIHEKIDFRKFKQKLLNM